MSSCWTMSPNCSSALSGSRGTRTHKRVVPAACFQDRFLIQSDDFRDFQIAGAGIEPTSRRSERRILPLDDPASCGAFRSDTRRWSKFASCGGRNRTCGLVVQSHEFLPAETTPQWEEGRVGLEPTRGCLTNTCSAAELPTRINSALRELSPPVQLRWQESNLRRGD